MLILYLYLMLPEGFV